MNKEKQNKAMFVSFCVEQYANARNLSTEDVTSMFEQQGIAEHLSEYYDVLHTQGAKRLVEDIDELLN